MENNSLSQYVKTRAARERSKRGRVLAALLARQAARYVKTGRSALSRGESALVWGMAAVLLLWGIARNLEPLSLS